VEGGKPYYLGGKVFISKNIRYEKHGNESFAKTDVSKALGSENKCF
jgi:hypothetical protein